MSDEPVPDCPAAFFLLVQDTDWPDTERLGVIETERLAQLNDRIKAGVDSMTPYLSVLFACFVVACPVCVP